MSHFLCWCLNKQLYKEETKFQKISAQNHGNQRNIDDQP